jgi:hypothetical protein
MMTTSTRGQTQYYNRMTGAWVYPYDWQLKLQKGDHYQIITEYFPVIYGLIIEALRNIGYYTAVGYSTLYPNGTEGILRIVEPTRLLTPKEFEAARARGWVPLEGEVQ